MNLLVIPDEIKTGELSKRDLSDYNAGDFVTRNGDDIQFVLLRDYDSVHVVCIIPNEEDYWVPGEFEFNLTRRYHHINRHLLPFAKSEFEKVKLKFPNEWFTTYEILK